MDNAMAAFGITSDVQPDDKPADVCYLWPENLPTWYLWQQLQTQWRTSMNGRDGLDYAGVLAYLRNVAHIKPRKFNDVFGCIQAMETASLNEWAKQAKQNNKG